MGAPHISIISTLYRSESFLDEFIEKCYVALKEIECDNFEIVIVNDGSPDNSLRKILQIKKQYPEIKVIDLSRNFGHHNAFLAGMKYSTGDLVFNIDSDLEVSPMVLVDFYKELMANDLDVVYGYQEARKGSYSEKLFGGIFWKAFNMLSESKVPANVLTERLMKRKYVDSLVQCGDKNIFLAGLMYWTGFEQKGIPVKKLQRSSKATYTFSKRLSLLINAMSSFSAYPLKLLFRVGGIITFISLAYAGYLLVRKVLDPKEILSGYTSLIIAILFSTGLIMSSLGIIGIYLEKIFNQVKDRPIYIIKNIHN